MIVSDVVGQRVEKGLPVALDDSANMLRMSSLFAAAPIIGYVRFPVEIE
jgi:hypothetical protein